MSDPTSPGGGPPPQSPKRSTNTVPVVLVAVVAVLAVLGGLALVLGDDDSDTSEPDGRSGGRPDETGQEDAGGGDIDQFGDTLAAAFDQHDAETLTGLSCADADAAVAGAIAAVDEVDAAASLPAGEAEPGTYLVPLGLVVGDDARPYEVTVVERDGGFCVQDIAEDSYAGAGVPEEDEGRVQPPARDRSGPD
jgi:hypothetical protein